MAGPLNRFVARRALGLVAAAVTLALALTASWLCARSLSDAALFSGWLLAILIVVLVALQARKKLTYPPLLRAAIWLQVHIYAGMVALGVFFLHAGLHWPTGPLETTLAVLFLATALSGVAGLIITRRVPPRLAAMGEPVIFERIPRFRRQIAEEARQLVVQGVEVSGAMVLGDFYERELADFFSRPRHLLAQIIHSDRPRVRTLGKLRALDRYLTDEERRQAQALEQLIELKHNLDGQYAMLGTLKLWLFIHIPMTYAMLGFAVAHVLLVYQARSPR